MTANSGIDAHDAAGVRSGSDANAETALDAGESNAYGAPASVNAHAGAAGAAAEAAAGTAARADAGGAAGAFARTEAAGMGAHAGALANPYAGTPAYPAKDASGSAPATAPTPATAGAHAACSPMPTGSAAHFCGKTDVGCVREHNEDSLIVSPPLLAVADGMGGHAAGEVASEIAIKTLAEAHLGHADADALHRAVTAANAAIIRGVETGIGREGMGTTLTAAVLEDERLVIAQVGDSRAYLLHAGHLQQLTRDHSLMADFIEAGRLTPEEARCHPQRSVITRALGSAPDTEPDIYELNVMTGDRLLLCSDGLTTMVTDDVIEDILRTEPTPERCVDELIEEAKVLGGFDNVTAIVADVTGFAEKRERKTTRRARRTAIVVVCLIVAAIAAAAAGFGMWVGNAAYLADRDGTVAVYRGVNDELFGRSLGELEAVSNVPTDKLNAGLAARLKDKGVAADSVEDAELLLVGYAEELGMTGLKLTYANDGEAADADAAEKAQATASAAASANASPTAPAVGGGGGSASASASPAASGGTAASASPTADA